MTSVTDRAAGRRPNPAELRGRAAGVSILAFFGLGWTGDGISALPKAVGVGVFVVAAVVSVVLVVASRGVASRGVADEAGLGVRYGLIVAGEVVGIVIIVGVLSSSGHPRLISAAIAVAVGVHFFPLGRLFDIGAYHLTGAALCIAGLATFVLAPLTGSGALWTALPGFGSAVALYVTCGYLLRTMLGP